MDDQVGGQHPQAILQKPARILHDNSAFRPRNLGFSALGHHISVGVSLRMQFLRGLAKLLRNQLKHRNTQRKHVDPLTVGLIVKQRKVYLTRPTKLAVGLVMFAEI